MPLELFTYNYNTCTLGICQYKKYSSEVNAGFGLILRNGKLCLQQPELYPTQILHQQFIDLYLENSHFLAGKTPYKIQTELTVHTICIFEY